MGDMTVLQAVKLMLDRMGRSGSTTTAFFNATDGTIGDINIMQRDLNRAFEHWGETRDTTKLAELAATLQVLGRLTDTQYEQIMEALDGEN